MTILLRCIRRPTPYDQHSDSDSDKKNDESELHSIHLLLEFFFAFSVRWLVCCWFWHQKIQCNGARTALPPRVAAGHVVFSEMTSIVSDCICILLTKSPNVVAGTIIRCL
jgi:hypothetical protein